MNLSLVPVDDLIAELDKRFESCAVLSHKFHIEGDAFDWHLKGNRMTLLGLCEITADKIRSGYEADDTGEFTKD